MFLYGSYFIRVKTKKTTAIKAMVITPQSYVPAYTFQKLVKTIKFVVCIDL